MTTLNENITILGNSPIVNSKASETYVSVTFRYGDMVWEGYVPIEYRRTGTAIDFDDKETLYSHLNFVYDAMKPENSPLGKRSKKNSGLLNHAPIPQKHSLINWQKVDGNVVPARCHAIRTLSEEFKTSKSLDTP